MYRLIFSVPDQPPQDILVNSQGKHAVQVNWRPVPPEYTNGEVLGYKVFYSDANNTSRVNISATETRTKIDGLRPSTNYSFQILAFTAKGDGAVSTKYFAKTQSGNEDLFRQDTCCFTGKSPTLWGL